MAAEADGGAVIDLNGAIDLHVHTAPDVYERSVDDATLAREAAGEGMRAVMLKSHHTLTADRASLAAAGSGIEVLGGLALNYTVGGLNPAAVETALRFGARQIWMPTIHARHCLEHAVQPMFRDERRADRPGLTVLDGAGRVDAALRPVLELIRDHGAVLGTGHLAPQESLALLRFARELGLARLLVTHPLMSFTRFTAGQMRAAAELGAVLEFDALSCSPRWPEAVPPAATAAAIRAVGAAHCVLATDGGQADNPHPPRMLREFAAALHAQGILEADLRTMMCDNPARLLGL